MFLIILLPFRFIACLEGGEGHATLGTRVLGTPLPKASPPRGHLAKRDSLPCYTVSHSRNRDGTGTLVPSNGCVSSFLCPARFELKVYFKFSLNLKYTLSLNQAGRQAVTMRGKVQTGRGACCVVGCNKRAGRDKVSFHRIPAVMQHQGVNTAALSCKWCHDWVIYCWQWSHSIERLLSLSHMTL